MRALVLVLASSGMRVGEALQIKLDDLQLENDPPKIKIRAEYTKTGERRTVFISREAKEALEEWLKVRDDYLKSALNKNRGLQKVGSGKKSIDDNRVFPFDIRVVEFSWQNLLKKAGLLKKDEATNVTRIRIHGLRKFFRSNLPPIVPVDIVEALMGHSGYLTECYRRYTEKQLGEYYKKGEHLVTIQMPKEIAEIESEFRDELNKNRKLIEDLIIENKEMRKENEELKSRLEAVMMALDIILEVAIKDPEILVQLKKLIGGKD